MAPVSAFAIRSQPYTYIKSSRRMLKLSDLKRCLLVTTARLCLYLVEVPADHCATVRDWLTQAFMVGAWQKIGARL